MQHHRVALGSYGHGQLFMVTAATAGVVPLALMHKQRAGMAGVVGISHIPVMAALVVEVTATMTC